MGHNIYGVFKVVQFVCCGFIVICTKSLGFILLLSQLCQLWHFRSFVVTLYLKKKMKLDHFAPFFHHFIAWSSAFTDRPAPPSGNPCYVGIPAAPRVHPGQCHDQTCEEKPYYRNPLVNHYLAINIHYMIVMSTVLDYDIYRHRCFTLTSTSPKNRQLMVACWPIIFMSEGLSHSCRASPPR